jgi:hypothetical protein
MASPRYLPDNSQAPAAAPRRPLHQLPAHGPSMTDENCRYFLTYTGVKLPLTLLNELEPDQLENRITFFRGYYDADGQLVRLQKMVYGEVEMEHRYEYAPGGALRRAEIVDIDGELTEMNFEV